MRDLLEILIPVFVAVYMLGGLLAGLAAAENVDMPMTLAFVWPVVLFQSISDQLRERSRRHQCKKCSAPKRPGKYCHRCGAAL